MSYFSTMRWNCAASRAAPASAKNDSKPGRENSSSTRAGASPATEYLCGTSLGAWTKSPAAAVSVCPPQVSSIAPSST
jgi:hypothetical protein